MALIYEKLFKEWLQFPKKHLVMERKIKEMWKDYQGGNEEKEWETQSINKSDQRRTKVNLFLCWQHYRQNLISNVSGTLSNQISLLGPHQTRSLTALHPLSPNLLFYLFISFLIPHRLFLFIYPSLYLWHYLIFSSNSSNRFSFEMSISFVSPFFIFSSHSCHHCYFWPSHGKLCSLILFL